MELIRDYVQDVVGADFPVPQNLFVEYARNYTAYYESINGRSPDFRTERDPAEREERRNGLQDEYQLIRFAPDGDLKYFLTAINTTINARLSAADNNDEKSYWSQAVKEARNNGYAFGADSMFQMSSEWIDIELEESLISTAVTGMIASLGLAFGIIFLTSRNLIVSLLAIFCIGAVVATLIANMVWMGWTLTVLESIALTVLVGLSVDYTVHLCTAWVTAKPFQKQDGAMTRQQRLAVMLAELGVSVTGSAITTLLSAVPLLATVILFFFKFGAFLALVALWSWVYSFGLMTALLAIIGPTSHLDNLRWLYSMCHRSFWVGEKK